MRDSQQPWETVRDLQKLHWTIDTLIDYKQPWEIVRDMKQIHCTGKDSERKPAIITDCEKHVATP